MISSLVSKQSGKPLGTGRENWLLIGRNFMYIMMFYFEFFKVQRTSTQVSLSGQGCHTPRGAELHFYLLGTAHGSPYCSLEVNPSCERASQSSAGPAARFCNLGPGIFQISWFYILYVKRKIEEQDAKPKPAGWFFWGQFFWGHRDAMGWSKTQKHVGKWEYNERKYV